MMAKTAVATNASKNAKFSTNNDAPLRMMHAQKMQRTMVKIMGSKRLGRNEYEPEVN